MAPSPEDRLTGSDDDQDFEPVPKQRKRRRWGRWVMLAALVAGSGATAWHYYGDRLLMTDDDSVPLVKAEISPVKVKPADPGGMEIPDRDKLVYERLNGENPEGGQVERLLPPPEEPMPMPEETAETAPQAAGEGAGDMAMSPEPEATMPEGEVAADGQPAQLSPTPLDPATDEAVPDEPAASMPEAGVPEPPPTAPDDLPEVPSTETVMAAEEPEPVMAEPESGAASGTAATGTAGEAETAAPQAPEPETTSGQQQAAVDPSRTFRVQLAALRSEDRAHAEWERLRKRHSDLLGNLQLFVQRVDLGEDKGVFYRLRIGPLADEAASRALCEKLKSRDVGCLVVKPGS